MHTPMVEADCLPRRAVKPLASAMGSSHLHSPFGVSIVRKLRLMNTTADITFDSLGQYYQMAGVNCHMASHIQHIVFVMRLMESCRNIPGDNSPWGS